MLLLQPLNALSIIACWNCCKFPSNRYVFGSQGLLQRSIVVDDDDARKNKFMGQPKRKCAALNTAMPLDFIGNKLFSSISSARLSICNILKYVCVVGFCVLFEMIVQKCIKHMAIASAVINTIYQCLSEMQIV